MMPINNPGISLAPPAFGRLSSVAQGTDAQSDCREGLLFGILTRMSNSELQILAVVGSLNQNSVTRVVVQYAGEALARLGCRVDIFDPVREHLPLFNPDSSYSAAHYDPLQKRVAAADVLLLGTPDYHG